MINYCCYSATTGSIVSGGMCAPGTLGLQSVPAGCALLELDAPVFAQDWYIDISATPPKPALRPDFTGIIDKTAISADGKDAATLTGLPNPCQVTVIGPGIHASEQVTAGSFAFTSATPGRFNIYADGFPTKLFRKTVTAT